MALLAPNRTDSAFDNDQTIRSSRSAYSEFRKCDQPDFIRTEHGFADNIGFEALTTYGRHLRDSNVICDITGSSDATIPLETRYHSSSSAEVFVEWYRKLHRLENLETDWNGQGSAPPNRSARFNARKVLDQLLVIGLPPSKILPSAEDGVGISFLRDGRYANIECYNTGEIFSLRASNSGEPQVEEVTPADQHINRILADISAFLNS